MIIMVTCRLMRNDGDHQTAEAEHDRHNKIYIFPYIYECCCEIITLMQG